MNCKTAFNAAASPARTGAPQQPSPAAPLSPSRTLALVVASLMCAIPSPANAAADPSTKLVRCAEQSCLLVTGYREDTASAVAINGRVVPVEGQRKWRVALPVETVRDWSAPHARTIEVSLRDPDTQRGSTADVRLPIGLLGGVGDLADLVIRAD